MGIAAIIVSSKIYALQARPSWNSWQTTGFFIFTVVLLGTTTVAFLLSETEDEASQKI
ncbi:DmsC/YnfH family molybdoenzyme membrane anchor subunit [Desulfitobacterium sp. AusDCA]